jgi:hypothetical protein
MSFVNHKRVKEGDEEPAPLCGTELWISLISIDERVTCKECLRKMKEAK